MWPGVEPLKGEYNMTYVAEIRKIVDLCREYGIYVVMEFHQDAFSEAFCGEGVPFWGVKAEKGFPWPVDGLFKHWDTEVHEN
jgi:endoglycosylceramidase